MRRPIPSRSHCVCPATQLAVGGELLPSRSEDRTYERAAPACRKTALRMPTHRLDGCRKREFLILCSSEAVLSNGSVRSACCYQHDPRPTHHGLRSPPLPKVGC